MEVMGKRTSRRAPPDAFAPGSRVERREPMVAFVHLGYGLDANQYRERFLVGNEPDETPYGFHVAERLGVRVEFSHDQPEPPPMRFVRRAAKRLLGFDAIHLWRNRRAIARADVVWTMQESEWLALRFVGWFVPALRKPVVGNTVWLFDRWEQIPAPLRHLYARLARGRGVLTVHSDRYLSLMRQAFPNARVDRVYFGTSTETHPMIPPAARRWDAATPVRVLAAGNDRTRDWQTLLEAIGNDRRFEIDLICSWVTPETRIRYASVRPRETSAIHHLGTFKALYAWADIVVIPMRENRFSGITVALEATANGKPIVATRTGGVPTYFGEEAVRYVPFGDATALVSALTMEPDEAMRRVRAAQATFLSHDYSLTGLMRRYIALSYSLIDAASSPSTPRQ